MSTTKIHRFDWRHLRGITGIYCAIHYRTGMRYIGSSVCIGTRISRHIADARRGSLCCFHKAIMKHGENEFGWGIIEVCPRDMLQEREIHYIRQYKTASVMGFNTIENPGRHLFGSKHSEISKQRMSLAKKGRTLSSDHKQKISKSLLGRIVSQETIEKIRRSKAGKTLSESHRLSMSKANLGKRFSEETRMRMSLSHKARCAKKHQSL